MASLPESRRQGSKGQLCKWRGKETDRKDHSSHQTRQHTVPCSGLSYLPDGWKFAIVTVKPPKSYKDRKQTMRHSIHGQQLGDGFRRSVGLCKTQQQNHTLGPLPPHLMKDLGKSGLEDQPVYRPDSQGQGHHQCISLEQWLLKFVPENQQDCLCGKTCFPKSRKQTHRSGRKHKGPRKERKALPKLMPAFHI